MEKREALRSAVGTQHGVTTAGDSPVLPQQAAHTITVWLTESLPGIIGNYKQALHMHLEAMVIVALINATVIVAKRWKQPKCQQLGRPGATCLYNGIY